MNGRAYLYILDFAKAGVVAMLRMFADETGEYKDPTNPVFGVVGIVGRVETWHQLQAKWEDTLECCRVSAFHAIDVEYFSNEFTGWTHHQRERLLGLLVSVTQEHIDDLVLVGSITVMSEYGKLPEHRRTNLGNLYKFACMHAMFQGVNAAMEEFGGDSIEFVFDQKLKHVQLLNEAYDEMRDRSPWEHLCAGLSRADHRKVSPIQVADLLAYESNKYAKGLLAGKIPTDLRWPAEQLNKERNLSESKIVRFDYHTLMLSTDFDHSYENYLKETGQ